MNSLPSEIRREVRWAVSSRLLIALLLASIAFAVWSAVTDVGNARSTAAQFQATATNYAAAGESVEEALAAPLNVTTSATGQTDIDNPVRFDFEAAAAASAALNPLGSATTALSLAPFIFTPLISYIIGLFAATTDLRSGSIIVRWPQVQSVRIFIPAKIVLLLVAVLTLATALLIAALIAGMITSQLRALPLDDDLGTSAVDAGHVAALFAVFILVGLTFAALGFFIASLTRERVFSLVTFALAYYLLPILGTWDLRNLIPSISGPWLAFYGGFQPRATGDISTPLSAIVFTGCMALLLSGSATAWAFRDKTPANL